MVLLAFLLILHYYGDIDKGKLMHDFNCTSADDMKIGLLAERTRYYKEHQKGVSDMCRIMEEMRNETFEQGELSKARNIAISMYAGGLSIEQIVQFTGYPSETILEWLKEKEQ